MKLKIQSFAMLCLLAFSGCGSETSDLVATIDSTIPGSEVYYRGTLLGTTPLSVTRSMCNDHGFAIPTDSLIVDGWGEGLAFGTEDEDEAKIMFLVPEPQREKYLSIETPWGIRTKRSGSQGNYDGPPVELKTDFMTLVDSDGIRVELNPISTAEPSTEIEIHLTISGTAEKEIGGYRPELMALWGSYDTPWRNRSCSKMALGEKFSTISPSDSFDISMPIRTPDVAGDYSLFVVFHLFEEESGSNLEIGAVYSESRQLRVRR